MNSKANVLIVENDKIIAEDIKMSLEKGGYNVASVVSSGKEAIEEAKVHNFDLALIEIILEGEIDGIEAAKHLKQNFNIPFIYITSSADRKTLIRAKETEPLSYLVKPFEEKTLLATVDLALYKYRSDRSFNHKPGKKYSQSSEKKQTNTSQQGLREGWTRATFIIREDLLEKIKAIAYWDRKQIKEVLEDALESYMVDRVIIPVEK